MLKSSDHEAGRDSNLFGKPTDGAETETASRAETLIVRLRNQEFAGKGVGLRFAWIAGGDFRVAVFHKHRALAVLQNMSGFMEKREP